MADDPDADLFRDPAEVHPGVAWWEGATACAVCGWRGRSVVPVERGQSEPVVALECGGCGNLTLTPDHD